jgi:hypothetical protein
MNCKEKNIEITKCKLNPKIIGLRLSYVNIKDMNPRDPFVKRSELKRELTKLETRIDIKLKIFETNMNVKFASLTKLITDGFNGVNNRINNLVTRNNLVE